jgi:hypothetical protein
LAADRRISLALKASAKGIIDYRTYDYTAEWRKREELIFYGMGRELSEDIIKQRLALNGAIISSKNYEAKDPADFIARFYDIFNDYLTNVLPWVYTKEEKGKKPVSRAFVGSADKLVQRYKELFGTN